MALLVIKRRFQTQTKLLRGVLQRRELQQVWQLLRYDMCQELGCNSLNKSLSSHVERECLQTWPLLNQGQHGSSFIETKVKLSRVRCSPLEGCAESGLTLDVRPEDPVSSLSRAVSQSAPCPLSHDGGVQEDQQTILLPRLHLLPSSSRDSPRLPGWSPSGRPSLQTRTFLQSSRAR